MNFALMYTSEDVYCDVRYLQYTALTPIRCSDEFQ